MSGHACAPDQMLWLSQHASMGDCQARALDEPACVSPKRAIYQSGAPQNCYCANTSACGNSSTGGAPVISSWQDLYTHHGAMPAAWKGGGGAACGNLSKGAPASEVEMLWLSQQGSLRECQVAAAGELRCVAAPTKTIAYESGYIGTSHSQSISVHSHNARQ